MSKKDKDAEREEAIKRWEKQEKDRREHEEKAEHGTRYDKKKQWGEK